MAASQTIRTLKLSLLADVSKFGPDLKRAESDFDKFQGAISRAAVPATAALAAIGAAAFSAINAAADLEQTFGAVEQVFGGRAAQRLEEFAREAATSLGQSRQQALGAAQNFGILGRAAGLQGDALADFAIELSTLASDLAAFANTTPQDAIEALGSALRGEFNPIERYGVVLNAAAVQQLLLREGIVETAAEITAQDQIYGRYLALIEQTQIQSGQFAREQESIGSQTAIAKASLENFRAEVGEQLLPVFSEFIPLLQGMVQSFTETDPEQIVNIASAITILAGSIVAINTALKVFATLQAAWVALTSVGGLIATGVVGAGAVGYGIGQIAEQNIPTGAYEYDSILGRGQGNALGFTRQFAPLPAIPRTGGLSSQNIINISGFVGSPAELARAIDRAMEQAARQGQVRRP